MVSQENSALVVPEVVRIVVVSLYKLFGFLHSGKPAV